MCAKKIFSRNTKSIEGARKLEADCKHTKLCWTSDPPTHPRRGGVTFAFQQGLNLLAPSHCPTCVPTDQGTLTHLAILRTPYWVHRLGVWTAHATHDTAHCVWRQTLARFLWPLDVAAVRKNAKQLHVQAPLAAPAQAQPMNPPPPPGPALHPLPSRARRKPTNNGTDANIVFASGTGPGQGLSHLPPNT